MAELVAQEVIENKIHVIRGKKVMLDRDLAELYGVETRMLNQAVQRNPQRFPDDLMFQLTGDELKNLKSPIVTSSWGVTVSPICLRMGLYVRFHAPNITYLLKINK